ncbi:hypothetical protein [Corallococcus sp. AS-1-6]|uniref:hypothetical protein n=1 Tax=Corallococcus sp. AS-1-6 TaxID=2874599 RepID=UPI001CBDD1FD|nr:hypothetical protein [Corallococcus sp. AS-1-6]MBZ4371489.1 hypothetical protein [Corallococcus sp. AS-1-6]
MLRVLVAALVLASAAGCSSFRKQYLQRADVSDEERDAVRRRKIILGMPEEGVQASWGKPCGRKAETGQNGQTSVWMYCRGCPSAAARIDIATARYERARCAQEKSVTFTNGRVSRFAE